MTGGMGYYDGDNFGDGFADPYGDDGQGQQQGQRQQPRNNPLRDHLKKVEDQLDALRKQNDQLMAENRQSKIASVLTAKGYDPAVANLYGGEPDKLDEWLTNVGPLLAKQPTPAGTPGNGQQQGQAPASTVPAEGQAALQQLQQMGNMAAAPAGSEAEQIAQVRNAQSAEELTRYLQSQGNPHFWNG